MTPLQNPLTNVRLFTAAFQTVPEAKIRRIGEHLDTMEGNEATIHVERALLRLLDAADELNAAHTALSKALEGSKE